MSRAVSANETTALARRSSRQKLEAAIEAAIAALDALDGDPDLEPIEDDEPSLGAREGRPGGIAFDARFREWRDGADQTEWGRTGSSDDREYDEAEMGEPELGL